MIFLKPDLVENWAYWDDVFTPEECDAIINIGNKKQFEKAGFANPDDAPADPGYRISDISWLDELDVPFVYDRLTAVVNQINLKCFNFDLFGFTEDLQFTKYQAPGSTYKFHIDKVFGGAVRKLSMVIQLSDPNTYTGGDLELKYGEVSEKMGRKRGSVFFFPSYVVHRVTPVTEGTRYSLVTWLGGPPFK